MFVFSLVLLNGCSSEFESVASKVCKKITDEIYVSNPKTTCECYKKQLNTVLSEKEKTAYIKLNTGQKWATAEMDAEEIMAYWNKTRDIFKVCEGS
jgi:hypothetical protein